jgi:hypothetical protein
MTENENTPENLRKFLESDDPAMVQMGLAMAKGNGVPDEMLPTILRFYMWDDDKTVRAAAKSVFTKYAPEEIKAKVKENWKPRYRILSASIFSIKETVNAHTFDGGGKFQERILPFLEAFKSQDNFALIALEPLIKALGDKDSWGRQIAAKALGKIGDKRAVEPLIKTLKDGNIHVRRQPRPPYNYYSCSVIQALGDIGDKRAVEPLIKALEDKKSGPHAYQLEGIVRQNAAWALKQLGHEVE